MTVLGGSFLGDETEQRVCLMNAARGYNSSSLASTSMNCVIVQLLESCPAIQKATWVSHFRRNSEHDLQQWIDG